MRATNIAFLGILLACGAALAADSPVKVDNADVRILSVVDLPHHKGAMHQHDFNRVMIYLDAGDITLTTEAGHVDQQQWKAGQVAWSPKTGRHTSENVGDAPIHIVEIELKKPAPAAAPVRKPELDPVRIDPQHNILLFENDQVRVFRSWREPGGSEPMHEHVGVGRAAVMLTSIDAQVKLADGTASELHGSAGDVFWSGPVTHTSKNVGSANYEMVVVEVK
jgi:beta-alanine degradation protein BauB